MNEERNELNSPSVPSDTDHLTWLQHHMRGSEMRRLGIVMNWTGDTDEFRQKIDERLAQNSEVIHGMEGMKNE